VKKIVDFFKNKIFKYILIFMFVGFILILLGLLLSNRTDFMGWTNSVTFATVLLIGLLWLTFANSHGVFHIVTFGLKAFLNGFKKNYEKLDYLEYKLEKSEDKVSNEYYIGLGIVCAIYLTATIIMVIMAS